jgi:CSLREA domain-containing protein
MKHATAIFRITILIILLIGVVGSQSATADSLSPQATIQVNTDGDEYDDPVDLKPIPRCSLREAIQSANTDTAFGGCTTAGSGTDTITFVSSLTTFQLSIPGGYGTDNSVGDLNITSNLTIQGNGMNATIIDGSYQYVTRSRIFSIGNNDLDLSVTIRDLTVTDGNSRAEGAGAISNRETLLLENVAILNSYTELNGGGLGTLPANNGTTTLRRCLVQGNTAELKGGGIYANNTLVIEDSIIRNNGTVDSAIGYGGGVYSLTPLTITRTTFKSNSAAGHGGNLYLYYNGGTATIEDSVFTSGNSDGGNGGNLYITRTPSDQPFITIRRSEISMGSAGEGMGGGIYNDTGFTLENVTISGNAAETGGGIYSATASGGWPSTFNNITLAYNSHEGGSYGDGIYKAGAEDISISNSIVSLNGIAGGCGGRECDCYRGGVYISAGYNLGRGTSCAFENTGDEQYYNPSLGPLSYNWGYGRTHPLYFESVAIDLGNNATCEVDDQRGWYRPLEGPDLDEPPTATCDKGAYEYGHQLVFLPLITKP